MKKAFISHLGSEEKTLMFHGDRDDTVILKEKQPHEDSERLFEYLSEKDKIKIETVSIQNNVKILVLNKDQLS